MDLPEALAELLGEGATDGRDALVAAATEAWRRRHVNTMAGAAVISALHDLGLSYRQITDLTGIPTATAQRWARPPDADTD